jgi:hypothetical protein
MKPESLPVPEHKEPAEEREQDEGAVKEEDRVCQNFQEHGILDLLSYNPEQTKGVTQTSDEDYGSTRLNPAFFHPSTPPSKTIAFENP